MQSLPSQTLSSRTFVGLLFAQFTATFNDQAIHIVAVFYAVNMLVHYVGVKNMDEIGVVSIVTACFITPFFLLSSYAGPLADKYSKRSIIVFWKVAEVGMMLLAFLGLCLPHLADYGYGDPRTLALWSAIIVVSTVLMMGTHSTFFVPAKYGAMPEILHPSILSRGNGLLEGSTFMAQIFGTSVGGIMYAVLKSDITHDATGQAVLHPGREWLIGLMLVLLATLGTLTSILMGKIPAAAPDRKITRNWWQPMQENLLILWRSKPLIIAVIGIAFAACMTLFLRQTLLYEGEIKKEIRIQRMLVEKAHKLDGQHGQHAKPSSAPKRSPTLASANTAAVTLQAGQTGGSAAEAGPEAGHDTASPDEETASEGVGHILRKVFGIKGDEAEMAELIVSLLIAVVGFGVGIGSIFAGYLSGQRVELGLVPVGGVFLVVVSFILGLMLHSTLAVVICLFLIGISAGLYIVPLYTLLQHRAPKSSKGNVVSASNWLNVVAGIAAILLFFTMAKVLKTALGPSLSLAEVSNRPELRQEYVDQLEGLLRVPELLFLSMSMITALVMVLLKRRLPDIFLRSAVWLRAGGRNRLRVVGLNHLPTDGPIILATNASSFDHAMHVITATDRFTRFILIEEQAASPGPALLRGLASRTGMTTLRPGESSSADWDTAMGRGLDMLRRQDIVAISIDGEAASAQVTRLIDTWRHFHGATVIPVYCTANGRSTGHISDPHDPHDQRPFPRVVFGHPLPLEATLTQTRTAIAQLEAVTHDPSH